ERQSNQAILPQEVERLSQVALQIEALATVTQEEITGVQAFHKAGNAGNPMILPSAISQSARGGWRRTVKEKKRIVGLILVTLALTISGSYLYIKRKEFLPLPGKPFEKLTKQKLTAHG